LLLLNTHSRFNRLFLVDDSDEYWINRQECLLAINRAIKKHNVDFVQMYMLDTPPVYTSSKKLKQNEGFRQEGNDKTAVEAPVKADQESPNGSK